MSTNEFSQATVSVKANIYFEGKVVSHSLVTAEGEKKTLGLIFPGSYHFGTLAAERMEITSGSCRVQLDGSEDSSSYSGGEFFEVPANSGFQITIADGICEYICSFLD